MVIDFSTLLTCTDNDLAEIVCFHMVTKYMYFTCSFLCFLGYPAQQGPPQPGQAPYPTQPPQGYPYPQQPYPYPQAPGYPQQQQWR